MNILNKYRKFFIFILVCFLYLSFFKTNNSYIFAQASSSKAGISEVFNTIQILRENYFKKVDPYSLLKGAFWGLKDYAVKNNLNYSSIKKMRVDNKRTLEYNLRVFESAYGKLLMFNRGKVNENSLAYASIEGIMKSIQKKFQDPYSVVLDANEYRALQEQLNSMGFSGIGIFIELDKKYKGLPVIIEPVEHSPAKKAGIKAGDHIIKVNGHPIKGMGLDVISSLIRGPLGTPVTLTIRRRGLRDFNVRIYRQTVKMESVSYKMIGNIGYLKLRFFGDKTREEMRDALSYIVKMKPMGLILDLRNNGGGYIIAANDVCSFLMPEGKVITSVVNYRKGTCDIHKSSYSEFRSFPLVVIVNHFSASASEITAGCIKDHKLGVIIGTKTFGKGSVQTIHRIAGGGAIKYTTAHYLTPKGKDINKVGIKPDIPVIMENSLIGTKRDKQLKRALRYISSKQSNL